MSLKSIFAQVSSFFKGGWRRRQPAFTVKKQETGYWGEQLAVKMLKKKGYSVIGQRVRPDRRDEIDIVAVKSPYLVFVEVKTRKNELYGRPSSAVDSRKRRALCRAAKAFLRKARYPDYVYRFDIVEVVGEKEKEGEAEVRHLEDAFRFPAGTYLPVKK